jgi:hypothetical protein
MYDLPKPEIPKSLSPLISLIISANAGDISKT